MAVNEVVSYPDDADSDGGCYSREEGNEKETDLRHHLNGVHAASHLDILLRSFHFQKEKENG